MSEVLGWFMGSVLLCFSKTSRNKKTKTQYSESLGWDPRSRESGNIVFFVFFFFVFDVFGCPLTNDSFLPYVISSFMNPFQPTICIISLNVPFNMIM